MQSAARSVRLSLVCLTYLCTKQYCSTDDSCSYSFVNNDHRDDDDDDDDDDET